MLQLLPTKWIRVSTRTVIDLGPLVMTTQPGVGSLETPIQIAQLEGILDASRLRHKLILQYSSEYNTLSQPTESSVGRDAALGAGVGAGVGAGTAAALHHKRDQDDLRTASGRSFPAADSSDTSAPGSGLAGITGGTTAGPHSSSLANKADPRVDSDLDGSGTVGPHSSSLANQADPRVHSDLDGSRTAGPHSSSLANKADPRVDSDLDGSRTAGSAGYASGTDPTAGAVPQNVSGRDAYTGSGSEIGILPAGETPDAGYGPESRKHQHVSHGDEFVGDPCHHDGVEGHPLFTKGPHVTDTANLLDPHVTPELRVPSDSTATTPNRESGLIAQSGTSDVREVPGLGSNVYGDERQGRQAPALGSNDYDGERQGREVPEIGSVVQSGPHHGQETTLSEPVRQGENHQGRDAALVGGLGAAGAAAAYSSGRDDKPSAEHTSNITGPHHSKLLNKLDPGVHPDSTSSERPTSTAETSALIGSSGPGSSSHMPTSEEVGASHGHSRDAGVGAGLASTAVAGAADYESEQRPRNFDPTAKKTATSGIGSSDTAGTNTKGDFGHDVTSVVTGGLGTHETENYPRDDKDRGLTSQLPGFLGGHRKSKEPTDFRDNETTVAPATADPIGAKPESDPNYLRDAGLASAGIGGGLAAYETQKIHTRDEPVTASTDPTTYPPSGQEDGGRIADTYAGRDPALASGAVGTAVGTDDGVEFSKREAEKQAEASEKEYQKEQKAIHKEQVKHEKALEKEEKKHEKEELKQEKALEKEEKRLHKEEKKHEKELAKEEKEHHDDGKKHGGILGLFHRDKTDKSDETDVRDQNFDGSYQSTEATGVPDTGIGSSVEHETHKHVPNKLHKDPPAGYYESKGYYPPTTGDGTQPSDSTRTTGPTSGNEYSTGYQQATTGDVYPK